MTSSTDTEAPANGAKRPRGRPAGLGKVPGSGRKPGASNHVSRDAKEDVSSVLDKNAGPIFARLCSIAMGRPIQVGVGPNARTSRPSEGAQMRALEILAKKLRPDLASQQLSGDPEKPLFPQEPTAEENRDLARSIMDIFRQAQPASEPQRFLAPPEAPIVEPDLSDMEAKPAEPQLGETEVFDNGATVQFVETLPSLVKPNGEIIPGQGKYEVRDWAGVQHGLKRDRQAAREHAQRLPGCPTAVNGGAAA